MKRKSINILPFAFALIAAVLLLVPQKTFAVELGARSIRATVADQNGNPLPNVRVCRGISIGAGVGDGASPGWWCMKTGADGSYTFSHVVDNGYGKTIPISSTVIDPDAPGAPEEYCSGGSDLGYQNYMCPQNQTPNWGCLRRGHVVKVSQTGITCTPSQVNLDDAATGMTTNDGSTITVPFTCTVPAEPTPTGKILKTASADVDTSKYTNLQCVSAAHCDGTTTSCTQPTTATRRRMKIANAKDIANLMGVKGDTPVYVIECQTATSSVAGKKSYDLTTFGCSTGDSAADARLGLNGSASAMAPKLYTADGQVVANGIKASVLAEEYEWDSNATTAVSTIMMLGTESTTPQVINTGSGGQQQASLQFGAGCFLTDPFGRAFDSTTLEPLAQVAVTVNRNTNGALSKVGTQTTTHDGLYAFNVTDGTYRIAASKEGYNYPATNISSEARALYPRVLYGTDIVQKGVPIQADLPLVPKDSQAAKAFAAANKPSLITVLPHVEGDDYVVEGRVSHPYTKIGLIARKNGQERTVSTTEADTYGSFHIRVLKSEIQPNERLSALGLQKNSKFFKYGLEMVNVEIPFVSLTLSGIIKDDKGNRLANAAVEITTGMSNSPYKVVTTDATGLITVPAGELPNFPYELRVRGTDGLSRVQSVDQFIARNELGNRALAQANTGAVLGSSTNSPIVENVKLIFFAVLIPAILSLFLFNKKFS